MKTISTLLSFVQRSVHSAEKLLDMTDNVLDAGIIYSNEVKLDAVQSAAESQLDRANTLKLMQKSLPKS